MVNFKFTGRWIGVENALNNLPRELQSASLWGQQKAAEKLVKIAKAHINDQDLGWPPIDKATNSGDPRILVDTEQYYSSIKAWRKNNIYNAGVPTSVYNKRGVRISDIAMAHEHGLGRVPKRALWVPSIEEMGGSSGVADIVSTAIVNKLLKLRSLGFDVTLR